MSTELTTKGELIAVFTEEQFNAVKWKTHHHIGRSWSNRFSVVSYIDLIDEKGNTLDCASVWANKSPENI